MTFEEASAEFDSAVTQLSQVHDEIIKVYDTSEPSGEQAVIVRDLINAKLTPATDRYHKAVEAVLQASSEMARGEKS